MQGAYSALIYGATGAVGRELVNHLLKSQKWKKVNVVVRNPLPEWQNHPQKSKLHVETPLNMDELLQPQNFKYENVDVVFCALGSQIKFGEETFIKIDKTYPLKAADIALNNKISHYILVSAMGANSGSCLLYSRTKGEVQNELRLKKLPLLTIFRPGLIANRNNARFGEKLINCLCGCCIPKIESVDCAEVLMITAERDFEKSKASKGDVQLYENTEMLEIFQQGTQATNSNKKSKEESLLIKK